MDLAGDFSHSMFHMQYLSPITVVLYIFEVPLHSFADDTMVVPVPSSSVLGHSSLSPSPPRPIRFKTTTFQFCETDASLVSLDSHSASSFLHRRRVPRISTPLNVFLSPSPPRISVASSSAKLQRPPLTRIPAAGILVCRSSTYSPQPLLCTSRALLSIVESLCFAVHQSSRLQRNSPLKSRPEKRVHCTERKVHLHQSQAPCCHIQSFPVQTGEESPFESVSSSLLSHAKLSSPDWRREFIFHSHTNSLIHTNHVGGRQ
jgi:hypothetical protein